MKKTVLFVILQQYADWEAAYISSAINMLCHEQYQIKTVSLKKEYIQSIGGFNVMPDYDLNCIPNDYEAIILIGGMTWRNDNTKALNTIVSECYKKGKILAGICDASAFLGTTGVLNNVYHTSNDLNSLKQWAGAEYTGESKYIAKQAVRDKNVITANGTAAMEFAKEILNALNIENNKIYDWYNFHKLGFYTAPMPKM